MESKEGNTKGMCFLGTNKGTKAIKVLKIIGDASSLANHTSLIHHTECIAIVTLFLPQKVSPYTKNRRLE